MQMTTDQVDKSAPLDIVLSEAFLRLAYYVHRYGEISEPNLVRTYRDATFGKGEDDCLAMQDFA